MLGAIAAAGGCADSGTTGLADREPGALAGGAGTGTGAMHARDAALVGTWSRTVLTTGGSGYLQSSETRWTFAPDGSAERWLLTVDYGYGVGDRVVQTGAWRTAAGRVTIAYDAPPGGEVTFGYRVVSTTAGVQLSLDDLVFQRLSP